MSVGQAGDREAVEDQGAEEEAVDRLEPSQQGEDYRTRAPR
jgi:hypothetical protein